MILYPYEIRVFENEGKWSHPKLKYFIYRDLFTPLRSMESEIVDSVIVITNHELNCKIEIREF